MLAHRGGRCGCRAQKRSLLIVQNDQRVIVGRRRQINSIIDKIAKMNRRIDFAAFEMLAIESTINQIEITEIVDGWTVTVRVHVALHNGGRRNLLTTRCRNVCAVFWSG